MSSFMRETLLWTALLPLIVVDSSFADEEQGSPLSDDELSEIQDVVAEELGIDIWQLYGWQRDQDDVPPLSVAGL